MPNRACLVCPNPAEPGSSRCKQHGKGAWQGKRKGSNARYGAAWQTLRAKVLREEPTCRLGLPGCTVTSTDCDHIIAIEDGGTDERSNLRGLCNPCHKRHTQAQNRARRARKKARDGAKSRA